VDDPLAPHRLAIGRLLGETLDDLKQDAAAWTTAAASAASSSSSPKVTATSTVVKAAATSGHPPAKLRLLSGHDTTVVPLLAALGCYDGKWPPYASYIALELWAETDPSSGQEKFSVRIGSYASTFAWQPETRTIFIRQEKCTGYCWEAGQPLT